MHAEEGRLTVFQSHTGTITTPKSNQRGTELIRFNPTQVRLRLDGNVVNFFRVLRFNPTQVRLRRKERANWVDSSFVSIPHRYDYDFLSCKIPQYTRKFQSHTGTITTLMTFPFESSWDAFQSHTGTITTVREAGHAPPGAGFNPTQVRLRP